MTKNELLKLLILLARYVEIYHESTSDHNMNALSDAYSAVQNKLLGCVDRTMTPVELFDIVDAQCKVAQEGADVKALETDNERLRDALAKIYELNCELGYTLRMTRIGWDGTETCENTLEPINVIAKAMGEANPMGKEYRRLRDAVERLTSAGLSAAQGEVAKEDELDYWIRSWTEKDAKNATLADEARQSHEYIERLEAKLYDIVGSKRDFDEMLMTIKGE